MRYYHHLNNHRCRDGHIDVQTNIYTGSNLWSLIINKENLLLFFFYKSINWIYSCSRICTKESESKYFTTKTHLSQSQTCLLFKTLFLFQRKLKCHNVVQYLHLVLSLLLVSNKLIMWHWKGRLKLPQFLHVSFFRLWIWLPWAYILHV